MTFPVSAVPARAVPGSLIPGNPGWSPVIPGQQFSPAALYLRTGWDVGLQSIGISHLATEYILVPVAATKSGVSYNPTADAVQFAFMPTATQVPGSSDWVTGSWDVTAGDLIYPYSAKCLVGPSGATTLGIGTYVIYVKIFDSPETPILIAGQLQIT